MQGFKAYGSELELQGCLVFEALRTSAALISTERSIT